MSFHIDSQARGITDLIVLPCHGIYKNGDPEHDSSWYLADFQRGNYHPARFVAHAKKAVELLIANPHALLVTSGGDTKYPETAESESESYLRMMDYLKLLNDPKVRSRVLLERAARDSIQNLAYSQTMFYARVGRLPHTTTATGFPWKEKRFELHARHLGLSCSQFRYVAAPGPGDPDPTDSAAIPAGEQATYNAFLQDPYGCGPFLSGKRRSRTPPGYVCPYRTLCRSSPRLTAILDRLEGLAPHRRTRTYSIHYYQREHADWQVRDSKAAGIAIDRLSRLGYQRDSIRIEHPVPITEQRKGRFEDIRHWSGSLDEAAYLKLTDLLYVPTRPALDEEGLKHLPRSHSVVERAQLAAFRKCLAICSRKNVTLAPEFARQLTGAQRRFRSIDYHTFNTLGPKQKRLNPNIDRSNYLAEYHSLFGTREEGGGVLTGHCRRTCYYIAYTGTENELGVPVMSAFGLSGADTDRFLEMVASSRNLGELFDDVVLNTSRNDRLILVEVEQLAGSNWFEVQEIVDLTTSAS